MSNYNPGDVFVEYLILESPRGILNMTGLFQSCEIYESIFNPGIIGYFNIVDTEDYLGEFKISGDERVKISFLPPGGIPTSYNFNLNTIEDVSNAGSLKSKIYRLVCLSKETLEARTNIVSKSWNTQISGMIGDIFKTYLKSSKPINIEATKGVQRYISPEIKPYDVIKKLRKRAVSLENKSSNFVFFENAEGFNFVTIESLLKKDIIKKLKHVDTVGTSIPQTVDNNIISYHIKKQTSAIDRIGLGSLNTVVKTFDIRTKKYTTEIKKATEKDFGILGNITSNFFNKTFGSKPGKSIFVTKDSMDPATHLTEGMPNKSAHLAALMQNQINLEVHGDTIYKAGKCIWADIPKSVSTTGLHVNESLISGKFLIAKLAHVIRTPDIRPRYVVSMECLKMGYENGV